MENSNVLHIPDPSYYPCMILRGFLFHRILLFFMNPAPIIHGNTFGLE